MDTPTPADRRGWSLAAITAGITGMALVAILALPALAEEATVAPDQRDPGERHAAMVEQLTETRNGDTDAIAEVLAKRHEARMEHREARQAQRRSEHRSEPRGAHRGDGGGLGHDGDRPGPRGERRGTGPGDGTGPSQDCPLR